jgi:glutamate-1-semialdehyde 2,1-aminomutase
MPGGVNSPVRAFRSVGGDPPFIARGRGPRVWDVDDNEYLDYVCSWGPLILGHAPPPVLEAIGLAAAQGTSFGAPTEREVLFAELIRKLVPSIEKLRLVSSGTEATMSALRLARGFTGRDKVLKVEGGYHGHGDSFLVRAGSGAMTFGVPDSAGVPAGVAADTLTIPYNDLDAACRVFAQRGHEIAALIIEPVAGNMGVVPPLPGYLEGLRDATRRAGSLLILDEVITGFRVALGGAQALYHVQPDLTCLGKIIGGGLPVGAYGGRAEIMDRVAPDGPVYQAGTLSGNPLAVAAGHAALTALVGLDPYADLERRSARLADGMLAAAHERGVPLCVNRVGSMFTAFFTEGPVIDYPTAKRSDVKRYARFHAELLSRGVYLAPSQFEAGFLSTAHTDDDVARTLEAGRAAIAAL